jgi:hypothetical protein
MSDHALFACLDLATQPTGLRDCHDCMVAWFERFGLEKPSGVEGLPAPAKRRLAYLVSVLRVVGQRKVHQSWEDFELEQHGLVAGLPAEPLWACDPLPNALDDWAASWGFTRGVRISTLVTILEHGSF